MKESSNSDSDLVSVTVKITHNSISPSTVRLYYKIKKFFGGFLVFYSLNWDLI